MSDKDSNWRFADDVVVESEVIARARQQSLELGIDPISPATGAQAAVVVAATRAESVVEIGTGRRRLRPLAAHRRHRERS